MSYKTTHLKPTTIDEAVEALHDFTMTAKGPREAAMARFLKAVVPNVLYWLEAEKDRDTSPAEVLIAVVDGVVTIISMGILYGYRGSQAAKALEMVSSVLTRNLKALKSHLKDTTA